MTDAAADRWLSGVLGEPGGRPVDNVIRREQLALLIRQTPFLVFANVFNAAILCLLVWPHSPYTAAAWFAVLALASAYPMVAWVRRKAAYARASGSERGPRRAAIFAGAAGMVWAAAAPLFASSLNQGDLFLLYVLLSGMVAGGALTLAVVPRAAYSFTMPLVLVTLAGTLFSGDAKLTILGCWLAAYFAATLFAARTVVGAVLTAIRSLLNEAQEKIRTQERLRDFARIASDWFWESNSEGEIAEVFRDDAQPHLPAGLSLTDLRASPTGSDTTVPFPAGAGVPVQHRVCVFTGPDGQERIVDVNAQPFFGGNGNVTGYRGTFTDITETMRDRAKAEENARFLREIVDHSPASIVLKDLDDRYLLVNDVICKQMDRPMEAWIGRRPADVFPGELAATFEVEDQQVLKTRKAIEDEYEVLQADGETHTMSVTKFPIFNDQNEITGIGTIGLDVTEQRRLQAHLAHTQKIEAVGQLTAGLAHDFNNLLTAIMGNLDLLALRYKDDETAQRYVETARRAAANGADIIDRLLTFARRQELSPRTVRVADVFASFRTLAGQTLGDNIAIETAVGPDTWDISVDPGQFENALLNLAINARDAMPDGGILHMLADNHPLRAADVAGMDGVQPGNYVWIAITDTGKGMDSSVRDRAFDPFFTTKEVGKGTGLGLSMVFGFAQQSGGFANLYSKPGTGTTVEFFLPQAKADT